MAKCAVCKGFGVIEAAPSASFPGGMVNCPACQPEIPVGGGGASREPSRDFPADFGMPKVIPGPRMVCLPLDGERKLFVAPDHVVAVEDTATADVCLVMLATGNHFHAPGTAAEVVAKLGVRL